MAQRILDRMAILYDFEAYAPFRVGRFSVWYRNKKRNMDEKRWMITFTRW